MSNNKGPWATPRSWAMVQEALGKPAASNLKKFVELADELPPVPTYEQAIVHMYREAKYIVEQGEKLAGSLRWHKGAMRDIRRQIDNWRGQLWHYAAGPTHRRAVKELADLYRLHVEHLDKLWEAQEKYNAWAKLYGDI